MSDEHVPVLNKGGLVRRGALAKLQSSKGLLHLDRITDLLATGHRVFYSDSDGEIIELAFGASGTALVSGGASTAPSFVDVATQAELDTHAAAADPHSGYLLESLLDAKGDIIAATADNTPARLAVGTNTHVLTADSTQATGLKWAAGGATAGGSDTQVQFNDGGSTLGGDSAFTWNKTTNTLAVGTVVLTGTATVPTAPTAGELCYHTPTGRKVLLIYNGTTWTPIISIGTFVVYVDKTDGTDAQDKGTAVDSAAFKTIQYAVDQIPPTFSGNVTININAETYTENVVIQGKSPSGSYTITLVGTLSNVDTRESAASTQGTGATRGTAVRSTGTWTANAHNGQLVRYTTGVDSGLTRVIDTNDTTTITIVGTWSGGAPGVGDTFVIENWGTIIAPTTGYAVKVDNYQVGVTLQTMKLTGTDTYALAVGNGSNCVADRCWLMGGFNEYVYSSLELSTCVVDTNYSGSDRLAYTRDFSFINIQRTKLGGTGWTEPCFALLVVGQNSSMSIGSAGTLGNGGNTFDAVGSGASDYCIHFARNSYASCYVAAADGQHFIRNAGGAGAVGLRVEVGGLAEFTTSATYITYSGNTTNSSADANGSYIL